MVEHKNNYQKRMSHPLFVHIFMTESKINIFTFYTNSFGQLYYISFLNYSVKKKKKKKTEQEKSLAGVSEH